MPSPNYQYLINLAEPSDQERSRCTYECFGAGTLCS